MKIKRKFTLLEIMVALLVLGTLGTLTAVQIKKMVDRHRFEAEVAHFFATLQEVQVLSAAYQTDLALDIERQEGQFVYCFSTDEPFPPHLFSSKSVALPHVAAIHLKDVEVAKRHFDIYSGGRVEPAEVVSFHPVQKSDSALWLDLRRSPLLTCSCHKPPRFKQQIPAQPKRKSMRLPDGNQKSSI